MKYPRYPIIASDDPYLYEFYSEGPLKKAVFYTQIGRDLFNLGFGDWDEKFQILDDSSRSNNGDRDKILATVAYTALDFTDKFPNAQIFAEGSTSSRTRLYQMRIANNLLEINKNFEIGGLLEERWEPFKRGRNYTSFLIERKQNRKFDII